MDSNTDQQHTSIIADTLKSLRKKGVQLWSEKGRLHFRAPKGVLSAKEIDQLKNSKHEIVSLLEANPDRRLDEKAHDSKAHRTLVPMAFSQLQHWNAYKLHERPAIRQIASATRVKGKLNVNVLQMCIDEMVRRHDALRTRIVLDNGTPMQEIVGSASRRLIHVNLEALPKDEQEREILRLIDELILAPIDLAAGSLFGIELLRLSAQEHVLIVAMEHTISDAYSMDIFLRELFAAYTQTVRGLPLSLPPIKIQFPQYATERRDALRSWIEVHDAYWAEHLKGCGRLRFPADSRETDPSDVGWGSSPIRIGSSLKAEMHTWCRQKRTTLAMSAFTAYVALVSRWCESSDFVVGYVTDGRNPRLENTIGYLASMLHLRVNIGREDTLLDLLSAATDEYCKAYEHADYSYMEAQSPRPEFARNTSFNWVPQASQINTGGSNDSEGALVCTPVPFTHPMLKTLERDNEPVILLYDTDLEIEGGVYFPRNRFSASLMDCFARNFTVFLKELLVRPDVKIKHVPLLR